MIGMIAKSQAAARGVLKQPDRRHETALDAGAFKSERQAGSLRQILRDLWEARDLTTQFVKRDLTIRYSQAVMGFAWAMLMPVLIVCSGLIFRLVVSTLSGAPLGGDGLGSIAIKAIPWAFFSGAISLSTQSLISYSNLIGKVFFARETLPLSAVLAQGFDVLIGSVAVFLFLAFLGVHVGWNVAWFPVILVLLFLFTFGCSLLLSCGNLFFRDVKYIVQVVLNFGIFATPVLFDPQLLGARAASVMMALPLSPFIQALDIAVIKDHSLFRSLRVASRTGDVLVWSPWYLLYAVLTAVALPLIGLVVFRRASTRFAEVA